MNEFLSKFTIGHIDKDHEINGFPQNVFLALALKEQAKFIEDIDVSNVPDNLYSIIDCVKIDYEWNPNLKRITRNKIIYELFFHRNGDYVENIRIDTKLNLLNVFIRLSYVKTRLEFVKKDDSYIIDVSYIPLICLRFKQIGLDLEFQKEDIYDDIDMYFNYGYLNSEQRRKIIQNVVKFTVQGVKYIAEGGYCRKECLICDKFDEDLIIKVQKKIRSRRIKNIFFRDVYFNPYHPLGRKMIEKSCKKIEDYISGN